MPSRSSPVIRTMTRHEVDVAVDWAAREGWNPGLADADCFYAADPDGFLIAYLDHEPAACISVVRYDSSFGFLGFYIVKPEMRGRGYGYQIWQAGMERLEGCTVGLDGVVAQQENYRRQNEERRSTALRRKRGSGDECRSSHCFGPYLSQAKRR